MIVIGLYSHAKQALPISKNSNIFVTDFFHLIYRSYLTMFEIVFGSSKKIHNLIECIIFKGFQTFQNKNWNEIQNTKRYFQAWSLKTDYIVYPTTNILQSQLSVARLNKRKEKIQQIQQKQQKTFAVSKSWKEPSFPYIPKTDICCILKL